MDWMYTQRAPFAGTERGYTAPPNRLGAMPTDRMGINPMGLLEWLLWRSRGMLRGANVPDQDLESQLQLLQQMQANKGPLA